MKLSKTQFEIVSHIVNGNSVIATVRGKSMYFVAEDPSGNRTPVKTKSANWLLRKTLCGLQQTPNKEYVLIFSPYGLSILSDVIQEIQVKSKQLELSV